MPNSNAKTVERTETGILQKGNYASLKEIQEQLFNA